LPEQKLVEQKLVEQKLVEQKFIAKKIVQKSCLIKKSKSLKRMSNQGRLTEGQGFVQLTSSLRKVVL
jgi:hypothetical protein